MGVEQRAARRVTLATEDGGHVIGGFLHDLYLEPEVVDTLIRLQKEDHGLFLIVDDQVYRNGELVVESVDRTHRVSSITTAHQLENLQPLV